MPSDLGHVSLAQSLDLSGLEDVGSPVARLLCNDIKTHKNPSREPLLF